MTLGLPLSTMYAFLLVLARVAGMITFLPVPGFTNAPAQTTGMFTEPNVAFTVPFAEIALLHTGNFISVSTRTSRTPPSMMSAVAPRALKLVASRSPK